jgi:hypothetical protein
VVRARTATAEGRAALWPRLVDSYADFAEYAGWADREIPVVIFEPRTTTVPWHEQLILTGGLRRNSPPERQIEAR